MRDAHSTASTERSYMKSPAAWLAGIASVAIILLGVRALLDPVAASAGFGLPMHTESETTFVRIYGARNAFLGTLALGFLGLRMIRPLALLFTLAAVLPVLDALVIVSRLGLSAELIRHAAVLIVLVVASASLWRLDAKASALDDPPHPLP